MRLANLIVPTRVFTASLLLFCLLPSNTAVAQQDYQLSEVGLSVTVPDSWDRQQGDTIEKDGDYQFGFVYLTHTDTPSGIDDELFVARHDYFSADRLELRSKGESDEGIDSSFSLLEESLDIRNLPFDSWSASLYRVERESGYPSSLQIIIHGRLDSRAYKVVVGGLERSFDDNLNTYLSLLESVKII